METGSISNGYYLAAKGYQNVKNEKKEDGIQPVFADKTGFMQKVAEKSTASPKDMTLEEYKEYFNEKVNDLYTHPSQKNLNWIIDITDAAYRRMQADPEYEKQVLELLAKNKATNFECFVPQSAYIHIGETLEKCYEYTQGISDSYRRAKRLAEKRREELERQRKKRRKELLEKYLRKREEERKLRRKLLDEKIKKQRLLEEKVRKQKLEKDRLRRAWVNKRLLLKAANAYEANIMLEEEAKERQEALENWLVESLQYRYEDICQPLDK